MAGYHPLASEAEAIEQASRLTELDTLTQTIAARQLIIRDDRTPFLWRQFEGKPCWEVNFDGVSLRLRSAISGFRDKYARRFSVLLDGTTGQLIRIVSPFEGQDPDFRPQPSGAAAEAQLRGQDEIYEGLPPHPPRLTFLAALDVELTQGIGSPFLAKEIYASYVTHSRAGASPRCLGHYAEWIAAHAGGRTFRRHGARLAAQPHAKRGGRCDRPQSVRYQQSSAVTVTCSWR